MRKRFPFRKIATVSLAGYAAALTVAVVLAVTVGPFREPLNLSTSIRMLEARLDESERTRKKLEIERDRLLESIKKVQADWTAGKETIRTLREMVKNPEMEQRLVEANRLAEQLSQERAILIAKLNELQQQIQARADAKKVETGAEPNTPDTP